MTFFRRLLVVVGLLAFGFGVAALFDPGVAASLSADRSFVILLGIGSVLLGLAFLHQRYRADPEQFELPEPERVESLPVPGDDVDRLFAGVAGELSMRRRPNFRRELHERLGEAAVETQMLVNNYDRTAAVERLEAGTWTDDPRAAAFFLGHLPSWAPRRLRLRSYLTVKDRDRERAQHVIAELYRMVEGGDGER